MSASGKRVFVSRNHLCRVRVLPVRVGPARKIEVLMPAREFRTLAAVWRANSRLEFGLMAGSITAAGAVC